MTARDFEQTLTDSIGQTQMKGCTEVDKPEDDVCTFMSKKKTLCWTVTQHSESPAYSTLIIDRLSKKRPVRLRFCSLSARPQLVDIFETFTNFLS